MSDFILSHWDSLFSEYGSPRPRAVPADFSTTLRNTYGAILLGSHIALFLSGAVFMQTILYHQLYPKDSRRIKVMVLSIFILDLIGSAMIVATTWENLIVHYGSTESLDGSPWSMPMIIGLTAMTTFLVHCFFSYRIHTLSNRKWYITGVLLTLASTRLIAALVSMGALFYYGSFPRFFSKYEGVFLLGLVDQAVLDVLITAILCYFLRQRRSGLAGSDRVIDFLTLYTVETGMITCITTTSSFICWLAMPNNLLFFALYLPVGKLYGNTFLASLNARRTLTSRSQSGIAAGARTGDGYSMSILFPAGVETTQEQVTSRLAGSPPVRRTTGMSSKPVQVNIDIEHTTHRDGRSESGSELLHLDRSESEVDVGSTQDFKDGASLP